MKSFLAVDDGQLHFPHHVSPYAILAKAESSGGLAIALSTANQMIIPNTNLDTCMKRKGCARNCAGSMSVFCEGATVHKFKRSNS